MKSTEDKNAYEAMLIGTSLDELPSFARNRVLRLAEKRGFSEGRWTSRKNLTLLARAARIARDKMLDEGLVLGLDETDRFMHRMCSWLGLAVS
jgi:hypothetical protein